MSDMEVVPKSTRRKKFRVVTANSTYLVKAGWFRVMVIKEGNASPHVHGKLMDDIRREQRMMVGGKKGGLTAVVTSIKPL